MEGSLYIPSSGRNPGLVLERERRLLIKHYDFLKVTITGLTLKCVGRCRPTTLSVEYLYTIKYVVGKSPAVYATNPKIPYDKDIHMYKEDGSLCLYYPVDYSWTSDSNIYDTIIPWTHEWFLFYELYKLYGKWMHPSVSH